jgi:hypothetical protein
MRISKRAWQALGRSQKDGLPSGALPLLDIVTRSWFRHRNAI